MFSFPRRFKIVPYSVRTGRPISQSAHRNGAAFFRIVRSQLTHSKNCNLNEEEFQIRDTESEDGIGNDHEKVSEFKEVTERKRQGKLKTRQQLSELRNVAPRVRNIRGITWIM